MARKTKKTSTLKNKSQKTYTHKKIHEKNKKSNDTIVFKSLFLPFQITKLIFRPKNGKIQKTLQSLITQDYTRQRLLAVVTKIRNLIAFTL